MTNIHRDIQYKVRTHQINITCDIERRLDDIIDDQPKRSKQLAVNMRNVLRQLTWIETGMALQRNLGKVSSFILSKSDTSNLGN